jgi:hypothetical protein
VEGTSAPRLESRTRPTSTHRWLARRPVEELSRLFAIWLERLVLKMRRHIEIGLGRGVLLLAPDNHVVGHDAF